MASAIKHGATAALERVHFHISTALGFSSQVALSSTQLEERPLLVTESGRFAVDNACSMSAIRLRFEGDRRRDEVRVILLVVASCAEIVEVTDIY